MGTFYNSRALEWFEVGRTEFLRQVGLSYVEIESRGVMLPLTEAHVEYLGRAVYDDELELAVTAAMQGRVRVRFDIAIAHAQTSRPVARGWTVHGIVDAAGKALRPPAWLVETITEAGPEQG